LKSSLSDLLGASDDADDAALGAVASGEAAPICLIGAPCILHAEFSNFSKSNVKGCNFVTDMKRKSSVSLCATWTHTTLTVTHGDSESTETQCRHPSGTTRVQTTHEHFRMH